MLELLKLTINQAIKHQNFKFKTLTLNSRYNASLQHLFTQLFSSAGYIANKKMIISFIRDWIKDTY